MLGLLAFALLLAQDPAPAAEPAPAAAATPPVGAPAAADSPVDRMATALLAESGAPGLAVAAAKDGRLLHARGYGTADRATGEPLAADARFRIASISKPLTAATVLRLVERGELALDDPLVDRLPLARDADDADPRLRQVTLRHLLQHRGGWDRGVSGDPMFRAERIRAEQGLDHAPTRADIARHVFALPLDHDPGSAYAYSNFGYMLLGMVLEERVGKRYEDVVRDEVLVPLGIPGVRLGRTLREHRGPREVVYHGSRDTRAGVVDGVRGEQVPGPYGAWDLEAMDAHGGWVASAPELVRFGSALQTPGALLSAASLAAMAAHPTEAEPQPGVHYGLGWSVRTLGGGRGRNLWHTGSLDGTSTLLVLRHDGWCWALLFNARQDGEGRTLSALADARMHRAVDATRAWPERDLYADFGIE